MKLIDLSVPISPRVREPLPAKIEYANHEAGALQAAAALGLKQDDFPESKAWARPDDISGMDFVFREFNDTPLKDKSIGNEIVFRVG